MPGVLLRVGSRGSALALVQARAVTDALAARGHETELVRIETKGDVVTDKPLDQIGGSGLFIKEIERALLEERIDVAVHSMKDLPSQIAAGLTIAATMTRIDARDVLVSRGGGSIASLPDRAQVATGSLRRRSQLLSQRPDLSVVDLRGNVPTRIEKFHASSWSAIVLAAAGLLRLDRFDTPDCTAIPIEEMIPAVGQGSVALESRADDPRINATLAPMNHPESAAAIASERAFLARIEGGCHQPVGAHATIDGETLHLQGFVGTADGTRSLRESSSGQVQQAERLGASLASDMLAAGARELGFGSGA